MVRVAFGQKLIIYSLLINFVAGALYVTDPRSALYVALGAAGLSIVGLIVLGRGMGASAVWIAFLVLVMFAPLVNLLALLIVNAQATAALRAAGYKVGLFGASK